jgi:3-deoxy-7-phosphoheptulonate synthase
MIIVMRSDATKQQVHQVSNEIQQMGLKDHVIVGTDLTVVAVIGDDRKKDKSQLEPLAGVDRVMQVLAPYKIAAKQAKQERTQVRISDQCIVGGRHMPVIAGPCSVESEAQIMQIAEQVKAAGAHALRGGAFKPRTNPYSFQGLGEEGLKLLAKARKATGLAVVTEVLTPSEVELVAEYADCLQIGTRNCQN